MRKHVPAQCIFSESDLGIPVTSGIDKRAWLDDAYRTHKDAVFRTCLRFASGDRESALDCVHEVFVTAYERSHQLRDSDAGPWLHGIAVRASLMRLRRRRVYERIRGAITPLLSTRDDVDPEQLAARHDDAKELDRRMKALPPLERAVIVLVDLEERTQSETAELLALSKGHVSKLHKKALARLSKDWGHNA